VRKVYDKRAALTFFSRKVKRVSLAGVEGLFTNYYKKCFKMNRVATVKTAHFTLRLWCKISDCERSEYASFAQGESIHFNKR
jgi:hypothetical protein